MARKPTGRVGAGERIRPDQIPPAVLADLPYCAHCALRPDSDEVDGGRYYEHDPACPVSAACRGFGPREVERILDQNRGWAEWVLVRLWLMDRRG